MEKQEFKKIYETYKDFVFSVVVFHTHSKSERDDIFQEIWLEIYKSIDRFKGNSKLSTWIFSVSRNTIFTHFKKISKPVPSLVPPPQKSLEEKIFEKQFIQDAMEKLSDAEQEIIFCKYISDYSYEELSKMLNIPLTTVKSRLFEARKKLRETLFKDASQT